MTTKQNLKIKSEKDLIMNYFYILRRTIFYLDSRPKIIDDLAYRDRSKLSDALLHNRKTFENNKFARYKYLGLHKYYIGITEIID